MRELHRGVVVWNKSRKRDAFRQVNQRPRPQSEWLRADAPHLRIIDEQLWKRVQSRRQGAETLAARLAGGRLSGRPPKTATQKPKKADLLNAELAKAGGYSVLDQKNVTAWLDLRNRAAHAKYNEYTADQVALFISAVSDFIARTPA